MDTWWWGAEVDEQHHLGILRTVFNSTICYTNERATSGRSTFYALNLVGSRVEQLHPLTSLRLYQALCLPLLLYGSELWTLTKTELLCLEQVQRRILRTIQGLPIRCHSASLTTLLGVQDIQTLIQQRQLNFIKSLLLIWTGALPRMILCARSASSTAKGITRQYQVLSNLNLPGLSSLLSESPKCSSWKAFIKKHLGLTSYLISLKNAMIAMLANAPSSLTTQPPTGRSPLGTLSSTIWITSEFISWSDVMDWKLMLLVFAAELLMLSQGIPHANSVTRESLRILR